MPSDSPLPSILGQLNRHRSVDDRLGDELDRATAPALLPVAGHLVLFKKDHLILLTVALQDSSWNVEGLLRTFRWPVATDVEAVDE